MARRTSKDAESAEMVENQQTEAVSEEKETPKPMRESVYVISELAMNARKIFNTRQECVTAALRSAGRTEYTVSEAKEIVKKFLKKEVK